MDELKLPGGTWSQEIKNYEREKRRVVDQGFVSGPQLRLSGGIVQAQERVFDPLLQRYRDPETEYRQRVAEETARVSHLNRAQDIQILREQPFHVINQTSKLEAIAPGEDPARLGGNGTLGETQRTKQGRLIYPRSATDYNIMSNLPLAVHHWAPPEDRPQMKDRHPTSRLVPAFAVKDYNIVTNRYLDKHESKASMERKLNILEATQKHMKTGAFDPLTQQFADPRAEATIRTCDHAREVEMVLRAQSRVPPSYKGRESEFFGMISHEAKNKDMLHLYDTLEQERKERFKNRYIVEHNFHAQDIKGDHIREARRLNRVAVERFEEPVKRGYDIIENKPFGHGPKCKSLHDALPRARATPWEKATLGLEPDEQAFSATLPSKSSEARRLAPSGSEQQLRRPSSTRTTSTVGRSKSLANLDKASGRSAFSAPPAPKVPGDDVGSVYSRSRG